MDSMARAFSLSFDIVLRKKVSILLRVEKHRSDSADVSGVVTVISNNIYISENAL